MHYIAFMDDGNVTNALRVLQAADEIKAGVSGEFSSIHGISVNEFLLMRHLESAPLHRLARVDLAKRMHVNASTITRMVVPMEKIGLLERQAHDRDARLSFVALTATGRTRFGEAQATFAKQAGYVFGEDWSDAELESFAGMLLRIIGNRT